MEITTEKTNYLLVLAGDSGCCGTDYAIITVDDTLLHQLKSGAETLNASRGAPGGINVQMMDFSCQYLEVEKLNENLFHRIEQLKQNKEWQYGYVNKELYDELIVSSEIETCCSGTLNFGSDSFWFELYDEASTDGYYLVFRTNQIPIIAVL